MGFPRISYDDGSAHNIDFTRGPQGFECYIETRANDNLSTAGIRERVVEHNDILVAFTMPLLRLDDDMPAWNAFIGWALNGGQFNFYPNCTQFPAEYYHCVSEDKGYKPKRVGVKAFQASFVFRVVPDAQQPSGPDQVLKRFYGLA